MIYMHKETGATDDRDGWIASYSTDELGDRELTASEAFDVDQGVTLFQITPGYCTQNDGRCDTCALVSYGRDCQNNRLNDGFN